MRKRVRWIALALASAAPGCAPSLSAAGSQVRYVLRDEAPPSCGYVSDVAVSGDGFDAPESVEGLKVILRNHTASEGGNLLVIDTMERQVRPNGNDYYEGTGRAYRCPRS